MLFSDLLPALLGQYPQGVPMPLGGPMLPAMAKSPSNATVTPTLGAHNVPPAIEPASMLNALTNAQLKDLEGQKLKWQMGLMKDFTDQDLSGLMGLYSGLGAGAGTTMPGTNGSAFGGELPASKGIGGSGPLSQTMPGHLSLDQMADLARQAGFPEDKVPTIAAIAMGESGGNPLAHNTRGEDSYGLTQINADAHGKIASEALDPKRAFELAYKISKGGTDFSPWSVYKSGAYKAHLQPLTAPSSELAAVPDFGGMMAGNQGPSYAPLGPTPLSTAMAGATILPSGATGRTGLTNAQADRIAAEGADKANSQLTNYATQHGGFIGDPEYRAVASGADTQPTTTVTPLGGEATPAKATQAPPAFGTLAPGAPVTQRPSPPSLGAPMGAPTVMTPQPGANPQMVAAANMLRRAMGYSAAGLPVGQIMAQSVYNSPAFKAAVAEQQKAAEMRGALPYEQVTARERQLGTGTPYSQAVDAANRYPAGSPERAQAEAAIAKAAGISPVIGGERPGVPIQKWNPATGRYEIIGQVPHTGTGQLIGPDGSISMAPNAEAAIEAGATAQAAGSAAFRKETIPGPYGREQTTTARNLPGILAQAPVAPTAPGGGTMRVGPSLAPAPTAVAPTPVPGVVQTPAGTKDISQLTLGEMFPGGLQPGAPGIPTPPPPPPGMTYGKPSATEAETQKEDGQRASTYAKEAANNQRIYVDLQHIQDVLRAGVTTSRIAPIMGEFANIAQGLGLPTSFLPQKWNPNDLAVVDKAATDLIFEAVKKLPGQVRVAEIEGYKRANPGTDLPVATNMSILNDILAQGKWQDARGRLAAEYIASTGGAPLSAFDARFNALEPLTDASERLKNAYKARPEYKNELARGIGFPEDVRGDKKEAAGPVGNPLKTIKGDDGVTYHLYPDGKWWH